MGREEIPSPSPLGPLTPETGRGDGHGDLRAGLSQPLTSNSSWANGPCTLLGQHSRAGPDDVSVGKLALKLLEDSRAG